MKNSTKLEKVRKFLDENNIVYESRRKRYGHSDLWIPSLKIAVKIEGDDDDKFYQKHKKTTFPVFIRESETPKFIIEKMQATIIKSMMKEQQKIMMENEKGFKKKEQKKKYGHRD